MDASVLEKKPSFKMLELTFFVNWIGLPIKFLSFEVALYFYKSMIQPYMEYCCHVRAGASACYFELLDKQHELICRTVGPSLTASLEPLAHHRNVVSLIYIGIILVDVHLDWLNWFHFLILIDYMIFLSPFLGAARMSMSTIYFLAQLDSGILSL